MNGAFRVGVRAGLAFRRCSPIPPLPDSCHGSDYGICRLKGFPLVTPDVSGSDRREHRRALAAPLRSVSQNNDVLLSEAQPIPAVAYPPAASPQFDDKRAANAPNLLDGDHPFSKFWRAYNKALDERPILVKSATSFFGFLIGDIIAQNIVGLPFDYWRTFRLVLFGIFMDGPVGHVWYTLLDKNVYPTDPKSTNAVVTKMLLDQLLWAPAFSCVFFAFINTLDGHPEMIIPCIQSKLLPMLLANYAIWPLAHLINFRFVPSQQRILYINAVQIVWSAYLSHLSAGALRSTGMKH